MTAKKKLFSHEHGVSFSVSGYAVLDDGGDYMGDITTDEGYLPIGAKAGFRMDGSDYAWTSSQLRDIAGKIDEVAKDVTE